MHEITQNPIHFRHPQSIFLYQPITRALTTANLRPCVMPRRETRQEPFYPLAFQAEGVLSLPASVRLSVRPHPVRMITRHKFELESPNLHQICIQGYSRLVLKMEVIDLDLQVHLAFSTHKTAFNVALVHWSRPAEGCYTSQTCSCLSMEETW